MPLVGGEPGEDGHVSIHASRCREAMRCGHVAPGGAIRCFNPRLPLPGGDAIKLPDVKAGKSVSIHASRCREAMPEGRTDLNVTTRVSIHASRCREAMRAYPYLTRSLVCCFNPRLPLPGGDAPLPPRLPPAGKSFNPRLPLPGGDASVGTLIRHPFGVSIHASRCREAMRRPRRHAHDPGCFNPRLPLPGGDAGAAQRAGHRPMVSIHASRCREAMPMRRVDLICVRAGFNPRLPLPGGDALGHGAALYVQGVSIHASRCREAMPT